MDGLESAASSTPSVGPHPHFFFFLKKKGDKCEKTLHQAHPKLHKHELDREKKRMNFVLGEILMAATKHTRKNDLLHISL